MLVLCVVFCNFRTSPFRLVHSLPQGTSRPSSHLRRGALLCSRPRCLVPLGGADHSHVTPSLRLVLLGVDVEGVMRLLARRRADSRSEPEAVLEVSRSSTARGEEVCIRAFEPSAAFMQTRLTCAPLTVTVSQPESCDRCWPCRTLQWCSDEGEDDGMWPFGVRAVNSGTSWRHHARAHHA